MIRITYAPEQLRLAQQIRDDLSGSPALSQPLLIVLVSSQSNTDAHVKAEIEKAQAERVPVLPILCGKTALPPTLEGGKSLDFSSGYNRERLLQRLTQAAMGPAETRRANRRALTLVGCIALLMFAIALIAIAGGLVAFPVAEYNEEATFQAQWIGGLIGQTLEHVQPRTTEDALNFPATHQAAPTRLYLYIRETATALPNARGS